MINDEIAKILSEMTALKETAEEYKKAHPKMDEVVNNEMMNIFHRKISPKINKLIKKMGKNVPRGTSKKGVRE